MKKKIIKMNKISKKKKIKNHLLLNLLDENFNKFLSIPSICL